MVTAGTGGNGGGGLCAVRHLANWNGNVRFCLSNANRLTSATAFQRQILFSTHAKQITVSELEFLKPDLIIDALIGYGLTSGPQGKVRDLIVRIGDIRSAVLSLDIPSGVDATTGHHPGEFVKADRTLTLALPKTGLVSESAGELFLADIGIPRGVYQRLGLDYRSPFDGRPVIRLEHLTS